MAEDTQEGIDFNQVLFDLQGRAMQTAGEEEGQTEDMTLGVVCCQSLLATLRDDKSDGMEKLKRFNLARKIKGSSTDDDYATIRLNSKQKKMIEDQASQIFPTLVYARIYELLEGSTEDDDE